MSGNGDGERTGDAGGVARLLVHDWCWQLFDENLGGSEQDFPSLGWRQVWIQHSGSALVTEVREWCFSAGHPETDTHPAPYWQTTVALRQL